MRSTAAPPSPGSPHARASTMPTPFRVIYPPAAADADAELRQVVARRGAESDQMLGREHTIPTPTSTPTTPPAMPSPHARPGRASRMSMAVDAAVPLLTSAQMAAAAAAARTTVPSQTLIDPAAVELHRPENAVRRRLHQEFHNRPRVVLEKPPLLVTVPVLDRDAWAEDLCNCTRYFFCGCPEASMPPALVVATGAAQGAASYTAPRFAGPSEKIRQQQNLQAILNMNPDTADLEDLLAMAQQAPDTNTHRPTNRVQGASGAAADAPGGAVYVANIPERYPNPLTPPSTQADFLFAVDEDGGFSPQSGQSTWQTAAPAVDVRCDRSYTLPHHEQKQASAQRCRYLARRLFCTRCTVAHQTALLFEEERQRGRFPIRFCMECFFGREGRYSRSLATMIVVDVLTLGWCPFASCYMGCGTWLYTWRLRYLVRLRYRIVGQAWRDCCLGAFCAACAVDQVSSEMAIRGLLETMMVEDVARIVKMR